MFYPVSSNSHRRLRRRRGLFRNFSFPVLIRTKNATSIFDCTGIHARIAIDFFFHGRIQLTQSRPYSLIALLPPTTHCLAYKLGGGWAHLFSFVPCPLTLEPIDSIPSFLLFPLPRSVTNPSSLQPNQQQDRGRTSSSNR